MTLKRLEAEDIALRLERIDTAHPAARERDAEPPRPAWPAAVLLPLFRQDDAWRLLYIRRAEHQHDRHSGEVAFPGGRAEDQDASVAHTAMREAQEEIGLDPAQVRILGQLRPFHTVSDYLVTPVVGLIGWPLKLAPDPTEVAQVFSMPLDWLNDPAHHRVRIWPSRLHPQARKVIFFDELDGNRLWGISAQITVDFLRCIQGPPGPRSEET